MTLQPRRVVEIAVYSDQHARGQHFYSSVLSLEIVVGSPIFVACNIGDRNALLLNRDRSLKTKYLCSTVTTVDCCRARTRR
jgi:hypothetical protein